MRYPIRFLAIALGLATAAQAQPQQFYERYQAGRAQLERAEFEAAVATFKEALAASNGQAPDPNIYVALGYAQMRVGRFDEADLSFNLARKVLGKLTPTSRDQLKANTEVLRKLRGH